MSRRKKDPLRALTDTERSYLEQLSRAQSAPMVQVMRAHLLLAVADGQSYLEAAQSVGRRSNDAVSHLVSRFNQEGLAALTLRHGGSTTVSTFTLLVVLHDAGLSWQHNRSWCKTGQGVRMRKAGPVRVLDPDAEVKKC